MKPFAGPHQLLFLATEAALGSCWSLPGPEKRLDIRQNRDSLALANGSTPITQQTIKLGKGINTSLTGSIFVLTVITYCLLMKYTGILSRQVILPAKSLRDNIVAILSVKWPERFMGDSGETVGDVASDWVVFRKHGNSEALGFSELDERSPYFSQSKEKSMIRFQSFSPVMKTLVQIAVWNYFSCWLVLVMIVNSLLYNGFLTNNYSNDGKIRLFLIGIYALANFGHQIYTSTLVYRNFSFALYQSCWNILCRIFVFLPIDDYISMTMTDDLPLRYVYRLQNQDDTVWTRFSLALFGTAERADTYRTVSPKGASGSEKRNARLERQDKKESEYDKSVKPLREAEIKLYEKAADSALEKILANVAILLGICFATALAPWTSFQTFNAMNAQLGSYALLVSVGTGLLALISSVTQVSNATESAKTLLRLHEKAIEVDPKKHENNHYPHDLIFQKDPDFSFSSGIKKQSYLTPFGLWRLVSVMKKALCLLFGPALMLIPHFHGIDPKEGDDQDLYFTINGVPCVCRNPGDSISSELERCGLQNPSPDQDQDQGGGDGDGIKERTSGSADNDNLGL